MTHKYQTQINNNKHEQTIYIYIYIYIFNRFAHSAGPDPIYE